MSARRRVATLGVAVGGVLTGHTLTYLAISPDARARAEVLRHTGHAYLGLANDLALVAALTALAALFVGQLAAERPSDGLNGITRRIVTFQVSAFLLMEVLERLTAGVPLAGLIRAGVLPAGIFVQIAVALLAAAAIRWLLHAADRVAALLVGAAGNLRRRAIAVAIPAAVPPIAGRHRSATGVRGPPSAI